MIPYRYSPTRFLFPLRYGLSELRDGLRRLLGRAKRVEDYDPDADLCGRFAICLEKNGFVEQAESVWKIDSGNRWEGHTRSFAEAVLATGDKETARVAAEVVSD